MRQIGTSHGQAGGFGTGPGDDPDFGQRQHRGAGDAGTRHGDPGLRREGRDGALRDGAARDGSQAREADPHVRAFQERLEAARRRGGQGKLHDQDGDGQPEAQLPGMPLPLLRPAEADGAPTSPGSEGAPERSLHRFGLEPAASAADPSRPDRRESSSDAPPDRTSTPSPAPGRDTREPEHRRLLAEAKPPADALVALFTPQAAAAAHPRPVTDAPAGTASVEARVADIADRVERSLAADLGAGAGAPVSLRVPLDGAAGGVASLTVTASAEGVDIVLNRLSGEPALSADLVEAARGLSERLQRRLGRGAVRIFEGADAAPGLAEAAGSDVGWAGLSSLLARRPGST